MRTYRESMDVFALEGGVSSAFRIIDAANEFIAATEPWALARDAAKADELSQVLFDVAEAVRVAAVLLLPVMPKSAAEILRRVGRDARAADDLDWATRTGATMESASILKGDPLWPRAESRRLDTTAVGPGQTRDRSLEQEHRRGRVQEQSAGRCRHRLRRRRQRAAPRRRRRAGDKITIDDFMKVDLRVAKVLAAEKVPNSRKLVKLSIDVGTEQRTLVAGIAEAYEPEQLVGRTIVMVFNLKPAKLMGIESNGMVLAASPDGGKPTLVSFDQDIAPGTRVR